MIHRNLDEIEDVAGTVVIGGVSHNVLSMSGDGFRLLARLAAGELTDDAVLWELGAQVCPTADVGKLSGQKLGIVLGIAQAPAGRVEEQFPNADGPVEQTPPALA